MDSQRSQQNQKILPSHEIQETGLPSQEEQLERKSTIKSEFEQSVQTQGPGSFKHGIRQDDLQNPYTQQAKEYKAEPIEEAKDENVETSQRENGENVVQMHSLNQRKETQSSIRESDNQNERKQEEIFDAVIQKP